MPTHIGIGFSPETTASAAALKAATQAKEQIAKNKIDLALIFYTAHYSPLETLLTVRKTLNPAKLIGSSTAGLLLPELITLQGIIVIAVTSDEIDFGISAINDVAAHDAKEAGIDLAKETIANFAEPHRRLFLFFIDSLIKNHSPFIKGLEEVFGNIFPIIGAGSTDDFHFKKTSQLYQDRVLTGSAVGLLLGGALRIGFGNRHGWKPLGKPRYITSSENNVIKMIDGQKAISIYEEYFKEESRDLPFNRMKHIAILYPLGIYIPREKEYLLRNAVNLLPDGSIVCQGDIPQSAEIHLMIGNKDACRQAAAEAAKTVKDQLAGKEPKLILIFECLSRNKLLGREAFSEVQIIKDILGQRAPLAGMYSHGEIFPFPTQNSAIKTHLQNESITIVALG